MTDKDGQVLPVCAAQMAVLKTNVDILQATGQSFSKTAGELRECVTRLNTTVDNHAMSLTELKGALTNEVLPVIRGLRPLADAMSAKQTKDITRRIMTSSAPSDPVDYVEPVVKLFTRSRVIQGILALIIAVASLITGTQIQKDEDAIVENAPRRVHKQKAADVARDTEEP